MPLKPGDRIERYVIDSLLGSGGMGDVYRAHDPRLKRAVALKILHADKAQEPNRSGSGPGAAAKMMREAQLAASLDHPNVVAIFDVGQLDQPEELRGTTYLAMELIRGEPLRKYIGDPRVRMKKRIRWLEEMARALGAAHAAGLVHRDVKPENVMIREDGSVKVLDFGIAKRTIAAPIDATSSTEGYAVPTATAQGVIVGTPLYMAPEQLRAEPLDGRADQFAWGVVAYELLSGKAPWSLEGGGFSLVAQILQAPPKSLEGVQGVTPVVAGVVARALAKDPAARFATMGALLEELTGKPEGGDTEPKIPVSISDAPTENVRIASGSGPVLPEARRISEAPTERAAVAGVSAPELPDASTRRSAVENGGANVTDAKRRMRRWAAFSVGAFAVVSMVGFLVRARSPSPTPTASAPVAAGIVPGGCTVNADCHSPDGATICVHATHQCVKLDSTDCHPHADPAALASDETLWFGELYALGTDDGTVPERGTDLARQDFALASGALRAGDKHARPIGLVACDDGTDPRRAALHLVEELHVPAIIGFSRGSEIIDLSGSLLAPNGVLAVASLTPSPLITLLPRVPGTPPLVWRTTYGLTEAAVAAATFIAQVLEPELHREGVRKLRVALLREKNAGTQAFAEALFDALRFNGMSALDNASDYRDVVVDIGAATATVPYDDAVARLADFAPHIVVYVGGATIAKNVISPLEKAWPPRAPTPPRYLSMSELDEESLRIAQRGASTRHRFSGFTSLSTTAVNARFAMHYNQTFSSDLSRADVPSTGYDAFYILAYASFALDGEEPTGPNLARAIGRLVPPGLAIDVGPSGIYQAFSVLTTTDKSIDLNGTGGTLDFDVQTGEHEADLAVLCVNVDKSGTTIGDIESGMTYFARTKEMRGRMRCP